MTMKRPRAKRFSKRHLREKSDVLTIGSNGVLNVQYGNQISHERRSFALLSMRGSPALRFRRDVANNIPASYYDPARGFTSTPLLPRTKRTQGDRPDRQSVGRSLCLPLLLSSCSLLSSSLAISSRSLFSSFSIF